MQTLWKKIDFGETYEVGTEGHVRNVKTGRILTGTINEDGYIRVYLSEGGGKHGKHRSFYVHVLVAEAFLGPRPEGQQVRHWDGNPQNNRLDNLLYGTPSENILDTVRYGNHVWARKTCCGTCGTPYDEINTYVHPNGARGCRKCIRESGRRYDKRNQEERARRKRERRVEAARNRDTLTTGEVAKILNVSTETIRRMCSRGQIPLAPENPDLAGLHRRILRSDLEDYLQSRHHPE